MKCATHNQEATAVCAYCGRALCSVLNTLSLIYLIYLVATGQYVRGAEEANIRMILVRSNC
jgi:hypothetical protein